MHYSKTSNGFYSRSNTTLPIDAVEITHAQYRELLDGQSEGLAISANEAGQPVLISRPMPTPIEVTTRLLERIDTCADLTRYSISGDALRALEYSLAAAEAQTFAATGYTRNIPPMVAAWAINGRSPQQAADNIINKAAQFNTTLKLIRSTRLSAKEQIRTLMSAGETEQALAVTDQSIAAFNKIAEGNRNSSE